MHGDEQKWVDDAIQTTEKETLTELIKLRNEMRKEELMDAVIKL